MNNQPNNQNAGYQTAEQKRVLVVDDEPSICWAFEKLLEEDGHKVTTASSAEIGLAIAKDEALDLVLLDVRLPKEDGISALPKFLDATDGAPVIIMTAFGDLETAVQAVKRGAREYLIKPFKLDDARTVCRQAISERDVSSAKNIRTTKRPDERLVGLSPAMQQAFRQIALVAESDLAVLITGETGTGKELVATAIWQNSLRSDQIYLPISPVALNPDVIESELFGHVKGAFTGATSDRVGLFGQAEGGTILLDEIGDLPLSLQVKLLRVLERGEYTRVGDVTPRQCDVRMIAATNCDLVDSVKNGTFREDLYYRLNGLNVHLPPLRERIEDIRPLCEFFLSQLGEESASDKLDDTLIDELKQWPWHGNVRELKNAVQRAAVVARGRSLRIGDFPLPQSHHGSHGNAEETKGQTESSNNIANAVTEWLKERLANQTASDLHASMISEMEPTLLRMVLQHTDNNRAKAAELLGIHRGTLREKLRQHEIE